MAKKSYHLQEVKRLKNTKILHLLLIFAALATVGFVVLASPRSAKAVDIPLECQDGTDIPDNEGLGTNFCRTHDGSNPDGVFVCVNGETTPQYDRCQSTTGQPPVSQAVENACGNVTGSTVAQRQQCIANSGATPLERPQECTSDQNGVIDIITVPDDEDCPDGYTAAGGGHTCGEDDNAVETSINIGCRGKGNPIIDMLFAFLRFLSYGVGLGLIIAMIIAGIQYTASRGNPEATKKMVERLLALAAAIIVYILAFAILNYLIPGKLLT